MSYRSETSLVRERIVDKWIYPDIQNGLDLGYGGDPISIHSIAMDMPERYAQTHDEYEKEYPQHLFGNARHLYWFADGVMDYIYSSHLLEDFPDTSLVLLEWLRVLKPGGRLILNLPDESKYRAHCMATGQPYNQNHQQPAMSLNWMYNRLEDLGCHILHGEEIPPYSFIVVATK